MRMLTVTDFMSSNRKFSVSVDGTLLSHTTNPFTIHCRNLISQNTPWKTLRKYPFLISNLAQYNISKVCSKPEVYGSPNKHLWWVSRLHLVWQIILICYNLLPARDKRNLKVWQQQRQQCIYLKEYKVTILYVLQIAIMLI